MASKHTSPLDLEQDAWDQEAVVIGTDEVGRGALAGPVVAAAVVLAPGTRIEGLRDSKKLSPKRRAAIAARVYEVAAAVQVAARGAPTIDDRNILWASLDAMCEAVEATGQRCERDGHTLSLIHNRRCRR